MGKCRGSLHISHIDITPTGVSLLSGGTQQFTATGVQCDGSLTAVTVDWTAEGGTIDASGIYTAGSVGGVYKITATTNMPGPTYQTSVTVNVTGAALTIQSISVSPANVSVIAGRQQLFVATLHMSDGSTQSFSGTWATTSGSISGGGLLTAGNTTGTFVVTATQDAVQGTAVVSVTAAPTLTSLTVSPAAPSLKGGATQQFTALGNLSDGTTTTVAVTWAASAGSIDAATGLFTAPNSNTSVTITATAVGTSVTGTATVTVSTSAPAAPKAVIKTPANGFSVPVGTALVLDPSGSFSNGTNNPWYAKWTVKNGSGVVRFSFDGSNTDRTTAAQIQRYTPTVQESLLVDLEVIDSFGTSSGVSEISGNATASAPFLQSIKVSPTTASIAVGLQKQFTAQGVMSDGTLVNTPVNWSATGGTITTSGLYTAGNAAGSFTVSATSTTNPSLTGTATVTITNVVTLVSVVVSPASVTLAFGAQQQFTAVNHYSDGTTAAFSGTWSATGGSISVGGLFTAGSTAGVFTVTATQ